ncbi:MAG: hypothetical protein CMJ64_23230 [Planctomycetaceae bacterium]|nr:hypothetical protein [Planctomycetaceae bacterium]
MSQSPSSIKVVFLVGAATLLGGFLLAQDDKSATPSSSDEPVAEVTTEAEVADPEPEKQPAEPATPEPEPEAAAAPIDPAPAAAAHAASAPKRTVTRQGIIASLTIFVLAVFVGFEVITKVPPTLHTPLMSGSNAISGITLVGAVIVAATLSFSGFVGLLAVILATVNAVGGFVVTHRMLAMFSKR